MTRSLRLIGAAVFALSASLGAQDLQALTVTYTQSDVADVYTGYDRWEYSFYVDDATHMDISLPVVSDITLSDFLWGDRLTFWFDKVLDDSHAGELGSTPDTGRTANTGWDVFFWRASGGSIAWDGPWLSVVANQDRPQLDQAFILAVDWYPGKNLLFSPTASSLPNNVLSQFYYDNYETVTPTLRGGSSSVPEPSTLILLGSGLLGLLGVQRRRH